MYAFARHVSRPRHARRIEARRDKALALAARLARMADLTGSPTLRAAASLHLSASRRAADAALALRGTDRCLAGLAWLGVEVRP